MIVYEYCDRCPLRQDMLADVRGRPCIFTGCPRAPKPWEWKDQGPRGQQRGVSCPGCAVRLYVDAVVLDLLTMCPLCKTIIRVKGTGSWIKKLVARFRLSKQVRQDRAASNLWP